MKRLAYGYAYRGYYIERCPANQWNIYFGVPKSEGMEEIIHTRTADLIDEGQNSLKSAGKEIDSYLDGGS